MEPKYGIGDIIQVFFIDGFHNILIHEIETQSICIDKDVYTETQYYLYTILDNGKRGRINKHYVDGNPLTSQVA